MYFVRSNTSKSASTLAAARIYKLVKKEEPVLFLASGGSAAEAAFQTLKEVYIRLQKEGIDSRQYITLSLVDERYGPPGHTHSNWKLLENHGLTCELAVLHPILDGSTIDEATEAYNTFLQESADRADRGDLAIIGLFGIGADGHTAGILPHSPASRITDRSTFTSFYQAHPYERITITSSFFPHLLIAIAWAAGSEKWPTLRKLRTTVKPEEQPAQLLQRAHERVLFTDLPLKEHGLRRSHMIIGFIGLGKMGANMVRRILRAGHELVVTDMNPDAVAAAAAAGAIGAQNRTELLSTLTSKREKNYPLIVWLMIPSQFVDTELDALLPLLPAGSIVVDGGNSDFRLTRARAKRCAALGIDLVDTGTSGGILGLEQGYAMMIGGETRAVDILKPIFDALAPIDGWHHFGETGNGHYTKMVHNAIEYGLMQSYAEGYRMLKEGPVTGIDLAAAGRVWQHGSIIESLLNRLTTEALSENPELTGIDGFVSESGETRWTLEVARDAGIKLPVIAESFDVRLRSQKGETNFATKLLAAMRNKFGGHAINTK